jgi:hypothetical protein
MVHPPFFARVEALESARQTPSGGPGRLSGALTQDDHLLLGHRAHGMGNAADAVAGLAPPGERHPAGPKGRVVVHHHRRAVEALG